MRHARRLNALLEAGKTATAIILGTEAYERQRVASGGRWELSGPAMFMLLCQFDGRLEGWAICTKG